MNNNIENIDWNHMEKCPECGAYKGHAPTCSIMPEDYAKEELKRYYQAWLTKEMQQRKWAEQARLRTEFWQGKFLVVKNENNKLRKKLYSKPPTNLHIEENKIIENEK